MARKKYKRGINLNATGYTKGTATADNPYNVIPSNKITMEDVDVTIMALPIDENGNIIGMEFMNPNKKEDYTFKNAESVLEIPKYKRGVQMYRCGGKPKYQMGVNNSAGNTPYNMPIEAFPFQETPQVSTASSLIPQGVQPFNNIDPQASINNTDLLNTLNADINADPEDISNNIYNNPKIQFANPYSGVDIPTAAVTLGQSIESGNTLGTAASSLKLLTGLGRNFMSGMGQERRNQFVLNEANENRRDDLTQTTYLQEGGSAGNTPYLMPEDAQMNPIFAIEDSRDFVTSWLDHPETRKRYQSNTGAVSDNVIDSSIENVNTANVRTDKYYDDGIKGEYNPGSHSIAFYGEPTPETAVHEFTHSGAEDLDRIMSGYITENYGSPYEALRQNTGTSTTEEAIQRRYNIDPSTTFGRDKVQQQKKQLNYLTNPQGGEIYPRIMEMRRNLGVQPGDIITDEQIQQLQGNDEVNELFNIYNPEQIKEILNTIADADSNQDSRFYAQKGGINRNQQGNTSTDNLPIEKVLTGEYSGESIEPANAEIEGGEYRADNQGNVTEVLGNTHEQGGVDVNLEEGERILSDHTKLGKDKATMFRDDFDLEVKAGSTYADVLDNFKKKSGLNKLTKEIEELVKKVDEETQKEDSTTKELNMEFLSQKLNELEEKKKPLDAAKTVLFEKAFELQEKDKPENQEQEMFKIGGQMYNQAQIIEVSKKFNIDPDEALETIRKFQSGGAFDLGRLTGEGQALDYVPEGQGLTEERLFGNVTYDPLVMETIQNNPWFNWTGFDPSNKDDVERFQNQYNKLSSKGSKVKVDGKFGEQTQSIKIPLTQLEGINLQPNPVVTFSPDIEAQLPTIYQKAKAGEELTGEEKKVLEQAGKKLNAVLLPDQTPIAPSPLQPVLKTNRTYGRIEPAQIDPTRELTEIDRVQQSTNRALDALPDSARTAALAQVAANTQTATTNAVSQANRINTQQQQQADAFNIRQGDREVDAQAQDALNYELRMLTGLSKTESDIRNYFETLQELNLTNFNTINELNYLNALGDNFQFDGEGFTQVGRGDSAEEQLNRVRLAQALPKAKYGLKRKNHK